ncbi:MAG TPA: ribonuclease H-like domain-containing protein [Syntrophales bacterium]|nr:ribonuclease H-like domain-containing protein [Syntrophales bacterium]HOL58855.1 ribonuclease H-like domain-containing protein [Syntrophales bacterium]HPO35182.1 ribonuclease H-like domain-containing protein [Syntrophales bacterium]
MNIRDRLSQLARYRRATYTPDRREHHHNESIHPPLKELIPGEEVSNEKGCFYLTHNFHPGSLRHGHYVLRDFTPLDTALLAILVGDSSIGACHISDGLFLDTETTGLSGGTGTLPFLIGLGWFEKEGFVIKQVFIRDYDEEKAALLYVTEHIKKKRFLVTFNGKAFDVNLLNARLILNRLPPLLEEMPHADLLHPARRLLKHRLSDRSLTALEASVLGLSREGDVQGYEIPALYFDWLRRRDARTMVRVFEHNRLDILSLVTLTAKLTELVNPAVTSPSCEPIDKLAAGRIWAARGVFTPAIRLFESLRSASEDNYLWQTASRELSLIYRRLGHWPKAVSIWKQMVNKDPTDTFAYIELAKYYEHRAQNPALALKYAFSAKEHSPHSPEIDHRIERLLKRLNK